jgi:hypothetical protein
MGVPGRWLRHKIDGTIYNYNNILCNNSAVEEVTEEIAFPERFIPKKQKSRKTKLDLSTGEKVVADAKPKKKSTGMTVGATGGKKK